MRNASSMPPDRAPGLTCSDGLPGTPIHRMALPCEGFVHCLVKLLPIANATAAQLSPGKSALIIDSVMLALAAAGALTHAFEQVMVSVSLAVSLLDIRVHRGRRVHRF